MSPRRERPDALYAAAVERLEAVWGRTTELAQLMRGLSLNEVLWLRTVQFDADGIATINAQVPAASVAIANFGTITVAIAQSAPTDTPPIGSGAALVGPGKFVVWPLTGNTFTAWGRPGEELTVAAYARPLAPDAGAAGDPRMLPTDALAADGILYTAPHGERAVLAGFWAVNISTTDEAEFSITDPAVIDPLFATARVLVPVNLAPLESTEMEYVRGIQCAGSTIGLTISTGAGNLFVAARVC